MFNTGAGQICGCVGDNAGTAQQKLFTDITEEARPLLDVNRWCAFARKLPGPAGMIRQQGGPHPDREQHVGSTGMRRRGITRCCARFTTQGPCCGGGPASP